MMCYVGKATKIFIFLVAVVVVTGLVLGFGLFKHALHHKTHKCTDESCQQSTTPVIFPSPPTQPHGDNPSPNGPNPISPPPRDSPSENVPNPSVSPPPPLSLPPPPPPAESLPPPPPPSVVPPPAVSPPSPVSPGPVNF
ncbi:leucine-rich repeat extensin 3 [Olea europaea subsp. europaea]|uniref:Leucine-rich repeat extensin 3 n=1 Tax=Olea europaea subsp. europaea TaxID=158383 RepID=A0A8S0V8E3_OLEEU|nr:leucine-rich repeat extensin 3 [Olea europaea subsp. europaea]